MNDFTRYRSLSKKLGGRNLYLVGMMGSGKSKTGPYLAQKLGYKFLDIDELIENSTKRSISNIFHHEGELIFRKLEHEALEEISQRHSFVVATGGGIVTSSNNWGALHQGIVIWINPDRNILLTRLRSELNNRPLLKKDNLDNVLDSLLQDREPLYSQSDLNIIINRENPEQVAFLILEQLIDLINQKVDLNESQTIEG